MLIAYALALGIGGTLVLASLVLGGKGGDGDSDHDAGGGVDHDAGGDADQDADHDAEGDHEQEAMVVHGGHAMTHDAASADAAMAWLPVTSVRFWTFFMAFFGLTGITLTLAALGPGVLANALISAGVGYLSGASVVSIGRQLRRQSTSSSIGAGDYVGSEALVMLTVGPKRTGKVRLEVKGRTVELMADTEDEQEYAAGAKVVVYQMTSDGRALVTGPDEESAGLLES